MANFQPDSLIEYDGRLLNGTDLLYDTTQGVRIWGNATQDNYSIGDTTTGGVDATYGTNNLAFGQYALNTLYTGGTFSGVSSSGGGLFTFTAKACYIGQAILVSGTLTGSATITDYTNPKTYYIIATNGVWETNPSFNFTLSSTPGGTAITSTAGTVTGLTFRSIKSFNVAIGTNSLKLATYGSDNTAIGTDSLPSITTGVNNIAIGRNAGKNLTTTAYSIILGNNTLQGAGAGTGIGNTAIGAEILNNPTLSLLAYNTFIGSYIGTNNSYESLSNVGTYNVAIGSAAFAPTLISNTIGSFNIAIGALAGVQKNTSAVYGDGDENICIGYNAGRNATNSRQCIFIGNGPASGYGYANTQIGYNIPNQAGSNNIDILTNAGTTGFQYTSSSDRITLKAGTHNILGKVKVSSVAGTPVHGIENELDISSSTANGFGYYGSGVVQSSTTASAIGLYQINNLLSSHPGLANFDSFRAAQGTFSTTTPPDVQTGFRVMQSLISAKLNYGFLGTLPLQASRTIAAASGLVRNGTGTSVTCTTTVAHGYIVGNTIAIYNTDDPLFEVKSVAIDTVPTTTTFTYAQVGTASATTNNGTVYSLSNLNLNMNGAAANSFAGRLLVGRSVPAIETMQVVQAPGTTILQPDNQFVDGIVAIKNTATSAYGADISLIRSTSTTYTDMTALPTAWNIGHIYWGVPDGRKYVYAGSIHMRTTAATTAMTSGGGGATTDLIISVANAAEPAEIARFTGLTGQLQMAAGKSITIEGVQLNTSTKANTAWLASGTANATTFLRGDGTWATATGTVTTTSIARTFALMGA